MSGCSEYRASCSQAHSPTRPALRGFTYVQESVLFRASTPHVLAAMQLPSIRGCLPKAPQGTFAAWLIAMSNAHRLSSLSQGLALLFEIGDPTVDLRVGTNQRCSSRLRAADDSPRSTRRTVLIRVCSSVMGFSVRAPMVAKPSTTPSLSSLVYINPSLLPCLNYFNRPELRALFGSFTRH